MSNNLTNYNFLTLYKSSNEISEFYRDCLKEAKLYKRVTAYFNNDVFKHLMKGIPEFIKNDGYFQLVLSKEIDAKVIDDIQKGYSLKEKQKYALLSKEEIIRELESLGDCNELSVFSYLIAIGKLDVKIAYKKKGILHDKFGLISDDIHNLAYIGSNNFTDNAIENNDEAFSVTIDWEEPSRRELELISNLNSLFDDYWFNNKEDVITVDLPDPIITKMIDKIDYDFVKKYKENTDFVKLDLTDEGYISVYSNIDIDNFFSFRNFGVFTRFLSKENGKLVLTKINKVNELYQFYEKVAEVCNANNINFHLTYRLNNFFELRAINYFELQKKGIEIKDKDYINSDDFSKIKNGINSVVKRPLVDQQIIAASHIINIQRSLNFSVPGSGKTASVLGAFEYLNSLPKYDKRHVDKLLVIGPVNCSKSWRDEYEFVSYETSNHKPLNIIGSGRTFEKAQILEHDFPSSRLIIINYESVISLKDELDKLVDEKTFIVFDEIHRIKSITSQKYEVLLEISKKTRYRVALTGTPLPNGYIDLYNIISLLHDDYTSSYFRMNKSNLQKDDQIFKKSGIQNEQLNVILQPFYVRVNKMDLNVPVANPDHYIYIDVNEQEKTLYKNIKRNFKNSLERIIKYQEIGIIPFRVGDLDNDIEKITINVNTIDINEYYTSKINAFLKVLETTNRKCVVWCLFVDSINIITKILQNKGFKAKAIYGNIEQDERDKIIDKFNYSNEVEIIVSNPATLAESVSLHKACHDAHYLEYNYNLYQYLQSRDRIHRLGLKPEDETNYYLYINKYTDNVEDSIEYKIIAALKTKEKRMLNSIENGDFLFGNGDIDIKEK